MESIWKNKNIKLIVIIIRLFKAAEKYECLINENELFNAVKIILLLLLSDDIFYFFAYYTVLYARMSSPIWFSTFLEYTIIILHQLLIKKRFWLGLNLMYKYWFKFNTFKCKIYKTYHYNNNWLWITSYNRFHVKVKLLVSCLNKKNKKKIY